MMLKMRFRDYSSACFCCWTVKEFAVFILRTEVVALDLNIIDPQLAARHTFPNLEQLSFANRKELLRLQLTDYRCHTKLCVDLQGCSGVQDEAVQAIAAANVKWVKLNLGETQITDKGISELCEKCPHLSVK